MELHHSNLKSHPLQVSKSKSTFQSQNLCGKEVCSDSVEAGSNNLDTSSNLQDSSNTSTFLIFSAGSSCILEHQHDPLLFFK